MAGEEAAPGPGAAPAPDVDNLAGDDEFEEFEVQDWAEAAEAPEDAQQWEDDWDDDAVGDDFAKQLRVELDKAQ